MRWFDHNATAPLAREAREAWLRAQDEFWQNASSPSSTSARARLFLENCRERVAAVFGVADPGEIVFHSGATEGNNAVVAFEASREGSGRALISALEHPSVFAPAMRLFAGRATMIPACSDGRTDLDFLEKELRRGGVSFVAVMAANNETGVLQPWRDARSLAAAHGAKFHCDATQWIGRLPEEDLATADFFVAGGHKFGAPKGVGVSRIRGGDRAYSGALGGDQEHGRRAGTEDIPGIAAFTAALEAASSELPQKNPARRVARDDFEKRVLASIPGARVVSASSPRLPNTVSLTLPRHTNTRVVARLDRRGFAISTGSACANGAHKPSRILAAMGLGDDEVRRTVRVSSGRETLPEDWVALADAFAGVAAELDADAGDSPVIAV